jgi:hypothetical protein
LATAQDFISSFPDYFDREMRVKEDFQRIRAQATEHTRFSSDSALLQINRPNEPQNVKDYRNATRRRLTKSAVDKFKTKTSRIFRSSGFSINVDSLTSSLTEYLASKNYKYLNQQCDLMTYFFEYVYNHAIDDPNAVEILLPYNPLNEDVPPFYDLEEGGVEKNANIPIRKIIVPSDKIFAFNEHVFSWFGGYKTIKNEKDEIRSHRWFWLVDNAWFYRYIPVKETDEGIKYELQQWYFHDTGLEDEKVLPVNVMIGNIVFDEDDEFAYQASILSPFFEYADEFVNRFSDSQAVWVNSAYPIHVMEEMTCTAEGCLNGYVKTAGGTTVCSTCNGSARVQRPSPYGVLMKKANSGIDEKSSGKAYELINPDNETLKTTYEIPFDILRKGEKQIGLDVLENAIESGVSRAMRFEDVKDKLSEIAEKLVNFLERHLFFTECLLDVDRAKRKMPKVNMPVDFQLKSSIDLREDAENALQSDKLEKTLVYYRNIYKNNESLQRVYELAFKYSSTLLNTWEEVRDMFNMGVIEENDIVKRNLAIQIFRELSKDKKFIDAKEETLFDAADRLLEDKELLKKDALQLTDENGNAVQSFAQLEQKSALLDTVGGVQGIIGLSAAVASGTMTEQAAVNILVEIYGIAREVAATLIQLPANPISTDGKVTTEDNK